jgi:hypothetical protein
MSLELSNERSDHNLRVTRTRATTSALFLHLPPLGRRASLEILNHSRYEQLTVTGREDAEGDSSLQLVDE